MKGRPFVVSSKKCVHGAPEEECTDEKLEVSSLNNTTHSSPKLVAMSGFPVSFRLIEQKSSDSRVYHMYCGLIDGEEPYTIDQMCLFQDFVINSLRGIFPIYYIKILDNVCYPNFLPKSFDAERMGSGFHYVGHQIVPSSDRPNFRAGIPFDMDFDMEFFKAPSFSCSI